MISLEKLGKSWRRTRRQLRDLFHMETRPLGDVRRYAETQNCIIKDSTEIDAFIETFAPAPAADIAWKSSPSYPAPYIAALRDVTLLPGTKLLLTDDGRALSDETHLGFCQFGLRPKPANMKVSRGPKIRFVLPRPSAEPIATGIHLTDDHDRNYFHWIVEVLPRLYLYEQLTPDKTAPVLVSDRLNANLYALLRAICAPERQIHRLNRRRSYRVKRLIYPSDVSRAFDAIDQTPSVDTLYLPVPLLKQMAATIKAALHPAAGDSPKRIFVRRKSTLRRLLNEPEIENLLVQNGFRAVNPESLSVSEQVRLFSQAEIIVGPSGAAMANLLWCGVGTRIVILHPDHPLKKYPFWDALARISDSQISYMPGPRANNRSGRLAIHDDYHIDPQALSWIIATDPQVKSPSIEPVVVGF